MIGRMEPRARIRPLPPNFLSALPISAREVIQGNFPDDRQTSETALLFLQLTGNLYAQGRKFLLACYHCGIETGRYISLERLIEQNKERHYEVLEQSSQRWHEGKHDPWPTLNFLLFILTQACKEFESGD